MLVGVGGVVLLGHVITEQDVRQRLEAVRVMTRDVQRDRVLVADVLRERLAGVAIEHDHARRPLQAHEEVVLAALVVVQPADDALPRERDVRLPGPLGEQRLTPDLDHPAALVLVGAQRDALEAFDHALFAPLARTKSFTA